VAKYPDLDKGANSVLSGMQYPHGLMVAGAVLVVLGFVGFAFREKPDHKADGNGDEWEEVNDEDEAPTRVKHRQRD
jgi:hypothetical protein